MKKTALVLIAAMVLSLLAGCSSEIATQEYILDCGATLTAATGLEEIAQEPFTTTLQGKNLLIMLLDENRQMLGRDGMTLVDYAALVASGNGLADPFTQNEQGIYTNRYTNAEYFYHLSVHESGSSFWLVQMACKLRDRETYEPLFDQWCATVKLTDTVMAQVSNIKEEHFALDCGVNITLPDDMAQAAMDGYTAFLHNNKLGCVLLQEGKPEGWTLDDYCEALSEGYGLDALTENAQGVPCTEYTSENQGVRYFYYLTVFETEDSFWMCQLYCLESMKEVYGSYMPAWASSLTFPEVSE